MVLRECLEEHEDHVDLLYLTDCEDSLQAIHKWIGCGAKLNLSKSPDADILKAIIFKLQKRVEAGAATLYSTEVFEKKKEDKASRYMMAQLHTPACSS